MNETSIIARALRKTPRILNEIFSVFKILTSQGLKAAYHYIQLKRAYQRSDWNRLRHHLKEKINLRCKHKDYPLSKLVESLNIRSVEKIDYELIDENRLHLTKKFHNIIVDDALDLCEYYRYFGDFRIEYILRHQALNACLREQKSIKYATQRGLNAALELGMPDDVLAISHEKEIRTKDQPYIDEVRAIAHALSGEIDKAEALWHKQFKDNDYLFRDYIKGRSIAVVGPAPTEEEVGKEIDSYDLVVRTNYRIGSNEPASQYGSRTDISYYNSYRISSHLNDVIAAAHKLSWTILKSMNDELRFKQSLQAYSGNTRSAFLTHPLFFNGSPMAIQSILGDLIRFSPKHIKLFTSSFYNNGQAYRNNYKDPRKIDSDSAAISESLRIHEAFSGFAFVKNFSQAGLCSLDNLTGKVIALSMDQYAANINSSYGNCSLPINNSHG